MKKLIISLSLLFLLTGCWNYKELNDYAIITGVAIDKTDDKYELSVLISNSPKNSSDNNESGSQIVVYSGKGKTIFEAIKDIGLVSSKELYFNSFSILILSEDVAKDGINSAIDFFLRYSSSRNNFYVTVTKDCKAKDTLKILTPITNFPSQNISDNIKTSTHLQGTIKQVDFDSLLSDLIKDGIEPAVSSIKIVGDVEEGSDMSNLETSQPETYIKLGNLAIFKGDKLIDWADRNETLGINIITNNISEMYLNVNYKDGFVVVDTTSFDSKIKVDVKNNKPIVNIDLKGEAKIIEITGDIDIENSKELKEIEKKAEKLIKKYSRQAIDLAIKNKTDIFGFGLKFNQERPSYFKKVKKDWNNMLDEVDYNIKSNITFKNKASSKNSLEVTDDK